MSRGVPVKMGNSNPVEQPEARGMASWRRTVRDALHGDGVSLPPHIPPWRAFGDFLLVAFGPIYLLGLIVQLSDLLPGWIASGTLRLPESAERRNFLVSTVFVLPAAAAYYLAVRPIHFMSPRRLRMVYRGTNAMHAIERARQPPILYLRSFPFDTRASAVGRFMGGIERNFGFGLLQDDTAEMKVVRVLSRYGPVLAIGRPGDLREPPGALRFYVRDDLWQSKIEQIAPACQLVVLATGDSAGLQWELAHIAATLPPGKVVLWPHVNVGRASDTERQQDWERLTETIGTTLPRRLPSWQRVRTANFIAFDETWTPICIPTEACQPTLFERLNTRPSVHGLRTLLRRRAASTGG